MPRRYRRRRYAIARPLKTAKYSNETYAGEMVLSKTRPAGAMVIVPTTEILATRKVKNLTIRLNVTGNKWQIGENTNIDYGRALPYTVFCAVIYVPQGNAANGLNSAGFNDEVDVQSAISMYEPNQNVIMSGLLGPETPLVMKTRLARNLNAGDQIALIFQLDINSTYYHAIETCVTATANYAISY